VEVFGTFKEYPPSQNVGSFSLDQGAGETSTEREQR